MMIQTRYSTGLWRLYVRWRSSRMITVLPAPIQNQAKQIFERQQTGQKAKSMQDDNTDLKPYVAGESLRRVAWKTYAKTDGRVMVTRTTSPAQSSESSIGTLSSTLLGRELEAAISGLASWVEFSESNGAQYGLKLGLLTIPIGCGPAHATRCMIALALYDPSRATEVAL